MVAKAPYLYHSLASAFAVGDTCYEPELSAFACSQAHFGPLIRSNSANHLVRGTISATVVNQVVKAFSFTKLPLHLNPLVQLWDFTVVASTTGLQVNHQRLNPFPPTLVFTVDLP